MYYLSISNHEVAENENKHETLTVKCEVLELKKIRFK